MALVSPEFTKPIPFIVTLVVPSTLSKRGYASIM